MIVSKIIHDIKNPINGIMGFLQLLEDTTLNNQQLEYVNYIKECADLILTITNNLLDLAKLESNKIELEEITFNLYDIIERSIKPFSVKINEKKLKLEVIIDSDVPFFVIGDPTRLTQVIMNLMSNAIKFTNEGKILLKISIDNNYIINNKIIFVVEDTGIGMTEEAINKIFKPFTQADKSITRNFGGTGLGLAICKELVEIMGGEIKVKSYKGRGTKFTFTVKLKMV